MSGALRAPAPALTADRPHDVRYGLPAEVVYCKRCVLSNQRPNSTNELRYTPGTSKESTFIGDDRICDACRYTELKDTSVDWEARETALRALCDRHRSKDGSHDCIVPGSGGKDSHYVSYILKHEYGMNPLTVTWPPTLYTEIGRVNFDNWLRQHDNVTVKPNQHAHSTLTRLAFENLLHPFQTFVIGQRIVGPRVALRYRIPLIFYGEPHVEYGSRLSRKENTAATMPTEYYLDRHDEDALHIGGVSISRLVAEHGLDRRDLQQYLPLTTGEVAECPLQYHYLGYYKKWDPQEIYYLTQQQLGFQPNPERTEGTYSKYSSLDDKIDGFHYFTTFIKFGLGRATYDAAQEIRSGKITREEGVALVKRYDGEFPSRYFQDVLDYMGIDAERFWQVINAGRSEHLWCKNGEAWSLRHRDRL